LRPAAGRPPAATTVVATYTCNARIDAFSMRNHEIGSAAGHDQLFATFVRVGTAGKLLGTDMLVEGIARAADPNEQHRELTTLPGMGVARVLGRQLGWIDDSDQYRFAVRRQGLYAIAA
jgi:hypothetical protein